MPNKKELRETMVYETATIASYENAIANLDNICNKIIG